LSLQNHPIVAKEIAQCDANITSSNINITSISYMQALKNKQINTMV
jgi:hypothetical protein